ncbi:hypothetical protein X994_2782 [Burkholderia pseudomallei]|uniref:hypothetical protein n=1 Tax=Burkholderia pseudomallei TaxID=28450 RepID=UPI00052A7BB5|nr:hypothetical protein [Burkholderia pseudomallei]AIV77020.1 hypothetical protein X994_2782 [Burkholderia pseudomallei]
MLRTNQRLLHEISVQRDLLAYGTKCCQLGVTGCSVQNRFGDFHLKVLLADISSSLLIMGFELLGKAVRFRLDFNEVTPPSIIDAHVGEGGEISILENVESRCRELYSSSTSMLSYAIAREDWPLERTLIFLRSSLTGWQRNLRKWIEIGPTAVSELTFQSGLFRDCEVGEQIESRRRKEFWVGNVSLESEFLRSWYLSGNAYLEITTIDIVSDLLRRAIEEGIMELAKDLAY